MGRCSGTPRAFTLVELYYGCRLKFPVVPRIIRRVTGSLEDPRNCGKVLVGGNPTSEFAFEILRIHQGLFRASPIIFKSGPGPLTPPGMSVKYGKSAQLPARVESSSQAIGNQQQKVWKLIRFHLEDSKFSDESPVIYKGLQSPWAPSNE